MQCWASGFAHLINKNILEILHLIFARIMHSVIPYENAGIKTTFIARPNIPHRILFYPFFPTDGKTSVSEAFKDIT